MRLELKEQGTLGRDKWEGSGLSQANVKGLEPLKVFKETDNQISTLKRTLWLQCGERTGGRPHRRQGDLLS